MEDKISCPLVEKSIDISECIETVSVVDGILVETSLPKEYKRKSNWKEICKNCKYYKL